MADSVEEVERRMKMVNFTSPCNVSFKRSAGLASAYW